MTTLNSRGVTAPQGFLASGLHCGIKKPGLLDLALVVSERSGPIAGVFTNNQVVAAPVILDRRHLRRGMGMGRAILVNSGNANACTGTPGLKAAEKTAALVARAQHPHARSIHRLNRCDRSRPASRANRESL